MARKGSKGTTLPLETIERLEEKALKFARRAGGSKPLSIPQTIDILLNEDDKREAPQKVAA